MRFAAHLFTAIKGLESFEEQEAKLEIVRLNAEKRANRTNARRRGGSAFKDLFDESCPVNASERLAHKAKVFRSPHAAQRDTSNVAARTCV